MSFKADENAAEATIQKLLMCWFGRRGSQTNLHLDNGVKVAGVPMQQLFKLFHIPQDFAEANQLQIQCLVEPRKKSRFSSFLVYRSDRAFG